MKRIVLIVDDDIDSGKLLLLLLKKRGIEAVHVTTIVALHEILEHVEPTLVLLDNHLSDGLGLNEINHIKKTSPSCPVVLMTGEDWYHLGQVHELEKFDGVLRKPFSISEVEAHLQLAA